MATLQDIANDALLDLGVLAAGEVGDADDLENARRAANRLVDQAAAERLFIYSITATRWNIVSGTQAYTVGSGGDINVTRPSFIDRVTFQYTAPGTTFPVELPMGMMSDALWQAEPIKTLTSTLPSRCYYNPTFANSLGTLYLHPTPVSPPAQLIGTLYAPEQIGEFASLSTVINLPPGYRRWLVKSLAVEMAASYQRNLPPDILQAASEAKSVVKASNVRMYDLMLDRSVLGGAGAVPGYYIRSGY